ncbi:hypothetical protein K2173_003498 [Erythroxylum novogranatense]|uniref:Uncharacterized protein n=1 Tax=Erythroxylum novogranatense TaxID=1862640 RepID=A0AAV8TAB7_9ROSI|nr:hypothetical protein K2173_003498 [Erythroxylum novogranatense]
MGNCLANNGIVIPPNAKLEQRSAGKMTEQGSLSPGGGKSKKEHQGGKLVIDNNGHDDRFTRDGALRVKVVMTKKELKELLKHLKSNDNYSVEQLVSAMSLRSGGRTNNYIENGGVYGSWKPDLESIPENHS